ncbi:sensor histidine kinase [Rhodopseudomonas sp.]|uniref:sensor histidine kinase n=1 Tax=Rhodopseudomonas sp. TaxID=1078 RepID=UPI003B3ABC32
MREPPVSHHSSSDLQPCWSGETAGHHAMGAGGGGRRRSVDPDKPDVQANNDHSAAIGRYAATMSRELHHPLTSLVFDAEAALRWLDRPQADLREAVQGLERIRDSALRAVALVRSLHALALHAAPSVAPVLIEDLLDVVLRITAKDLQRHRIAVDTHRPAAAKCVRADPIQIQQVLLNLIDNAINAMAETPHADRRLTIKIFHRGNAVHCSIADSGPGMKAEVLDHAFDPFFSTSPDRKGLGLTIARAIISAHGGDMTASSQTGAGSTFSFHLEVAR